MYHACCTRYGAEVSRSSRQMRAQTTISRWSHYTTWFHGARYWDMLHRHFLGAPHGDKKALSTLVGRLAP